MKDASRAYNNNGLLMDELLNSGINECNEYSEVPMSIIGSKTGFKNSVTEMYRLYCRNGLDNARAVVVEPAYLKKLE